jgi:MoxR-like ATPase
MSERNPQLLQEPTPHDALQAIKSELVISTFMPGEYADVLAIAAGLSHDSAVIFDGSPGTGKTYIAKALGTIIGAEVGRVQGTPDLQPSDITGVEIFNMKTREMEFRPGPIFKNVFFHDEWTRTGPRTISGQLQGMAEGFVTVGGVDRDLPDSHLTIVTQNAQSFAQGTSPVPDAAADRFGFSLEMPKQDAETKKQIRQKKLHVPTQRIVGTEVSPRIREAAEGIHVEGELHDRALEAIERLAEHDFVDQESTFLDGYRSYDQMIRYGQALALLNGHERMTPLDLFTIGRYALRHRVVIDFDRAESGVTFDQLYTDVVNSLPDIDTAKYENQTKAA